VRKELAVRTVFNFLGPLTNPAGAQRQLVGVSDASMLDRMAGALRRLGATRALVVSAGDGLDEMSTSGPTRVVEVEGDEVRSYVVEPADLGLGAVDPAAVVGGTPAENAAVARRVFAGEPGPARDLVLANAGAALLAAGRVEDLRRGVVRAAEAVDSGAAASVLERFVARTRELAP